MVILVIWYGTFMLEYLLLEEPIFDLFVELNSA